MAKTTKDAQTAFEEVEWNHSDVPDWLQTIDFNKNVVKESTDAKESFKEAYQDFVRASELKPGTRIRCGDWVMTVTERSGDGHTVKPYRAVSVKGIKRAES